MFPAHSYTFVIALSSLFYSVITESVSSLESSSLLWGPYRPNVYFGVRPRLPNTILSGLMWANADSYHTMKHGMQVFLV